MTRFPGLLILLLSTILAVLGCGVMPQGQAVTRNFRLSGFTLPVNMVFTVSAGAPVQFSGIAASSDAAKSFVSRLVLQTVTEVLEQQGRSAGLPDVIISNILNQLTVQINYDPFECKTLSALKPGETMVKGVAMDKLPNCIIVGNTVTALCTVVSANGAQMCDLSMADNKIANIPPKHLSISGTFTTSNVIMANWSREMWQSVVNRAVRMLAAGPFRSNFVSALATVG
ncbi:hypothetical protein KIN20_017453 [Parelaphostrongylus tenuis]|uniref:Uncharacterized protein n=1 Tax=Parelaphostrongylus tenuis TaxID=148309 RepID=A0AAD5MNA4_PARTN|nr:hypothetical protein KIN20_017453 [Parelaphostrongylus tenuis]